MAFFNPALTILSVVATIIQYITFMENNPLRSIHEIHGSHRKELFLLINPKLFCMP
jgi:hypothetical protein